MVDRIQSPDESIRLPLQPDFAVVLFAIMLTVIVTLTFGLLPALRVSNVRRQERSREAQNLLSGGGGCMPDCGAGRIQFSSAVCGRTFGDNIDETHAAAARFFGRIASCSLRSPRSARRHQRFGISGRALARHPWSGERSAGELAPAFSGNTNNSFIAVNGEVNPEQASMLAVSPGWADAMKIPLLSGRDLRASDTSSNGALVNETFAKQYFGAANPIGKRFALQGVPGKLSVVGVVGNIRDAKCARTGSAAFLPFTGRTKRAAWP